MRVQLCGVSVQCTHCLYRLQAFQESPRSRGGFIWGDCEILGFTQDIRVTKTTKETTVSRANVLVVERDQATRQLVSQTLARAGYDVVEVDNVEEGIKAMRPSKGRRAIDVVLCNRHIPSKNGHDAIMHFLAHRPAVPVVMLADHPDLQYATQMFRQGVVDY